MFKKILIANRGEIACRVAATASRMGVRTVAVYSDADAEARHVRACDEAVHVGGSAPRDSYLQWQRIVDAALGHRRRSHPPRLRLPQRERGLRDRVRRGRPRVHWPAGIGHRGDGQQVGRESVDGHRRRAAGARLPRRRQRPRLPGRPSRAHRLPGADQGQRRRRRQGHAPRRRPGRLRRGAGVVPARGAIELRRPARAGGALCHAAAAHRDPGFRRRARPLHLPVRARLLGAAPTSEGAGGQRLRRA